MQVPRRYQTVIAAYADMITGGMFSCRQHASRQAVTGREMLKKCTDNIAEMREDDLQRRGCVDEIRWRRPWATSRVESKNKGRSRIYKRQRCQFSPECLELTPSRRISRTNSKMYMAKMAREAGTGTNTPLHVTTALSSRLPRLSRRTANSGQRQASRQVIPCRGEEPAWFAVSSGDSRQYHGLARLHSALPASFFGRFLLGDRSEREWL